MSWSDPVTNTSKHWNTLKLFNRNLWFRLDVAKFGWWWLMQIDGWMAMPSLPATPGPSSKPLTRPTCCGLIAAIVTRHAACTAFSAGKHPLYGHRYALQHVYCRSFGDCWCMYFAKGLSNSFHRSMPNYVGRASTNRGSSLGPWWWLQSPRWGTQRPPNRSSCNSPMRNVNPGLRNQGLIAPLLLHWRILERSHSNSLFHTFPGYSLQKKNKQLLLNPGLKFELILFFCSIQRMHTNATSATPRLALVNLETFGLFANVALQLHDAAVIRVLPQTYQKWNTIWKLETMQQCGPKARTYTKCSSLIIQKHIIQCLNATCQMWTKGFMFLTWVNKECLCLLDEHAIGFESLLQGPQNPGLRCTGCCTRMGLVRWE